MGHVGPMRNRFWVEVVMAGVTAILAVITLISREWIELVFQVDPDQGSGLLEWGIVGGLAGATVIFSLLARAEWRQTATGLSQ